MVSRLLTEKIQREILQALTNAYPDPLSGREYFEAFGHYDESVMRENLEALIKRGLVTKRQVRSCGRVNFITLSELTLTARYSSPY